MTLADALATTELLFLDTAPVIYYVEEHPHYLPVVETVFERADAGEVTFVTSPVTLAECLVLPLRHGRHEFVQAFTEIVIGGAHTRLQLIDYSIARQAASLRAQYNLSLLGAFQASVALAASCDAFLTNDPALRRVTSLRVLVLDDFIHSP